MPRVSVVIPSYNCGKYLKDALDSVLSQTYKDYEIVLVNDGSTDNTKDILKEYVSNPKMRCVDNETKKGPAASRNIGIKLSRGDLIAFLDADDLFLKDKLIEQVKIFDSNKNVYFSYTNESYFEKGIARDISSNRFHFSGDIFFYLKRSNFITVSTVMMKRSVLEKYRFDENPDIKGHEDWKFYLSLAFDGVKFYYIDKVLTKIRLRQGSVTTSENMNKSRKEVGVIARRYWKDFKKTINLCTISGEKALLRYAALKGKALVQGFPYEKRFNLPTPHERIIK